MAYHDDPRDTGVTDPDCRLRFLAAEMVSMLPRNRNDAILAVEYLTQMVDVVFPPSPEEEEPPQRD
jgi:hypothetical protein